MSSLANVHAALPAASRFSARVHHFARVDSTNQVARQLGRDGEPDGAVVVADEQTAGRGRRQRDWVSPRGAGLYVSILLRPHFAAKESGAAVQLVAGIAVAETLGGMLAHNPTLRWPNDCYVRDHKIAGVLVEAETSGDDFDFLVCGMGVNINHERDDFPADLRERATSLKLQVGHDVALVDVLAPLLAAFDAWETVWREHGLAPIRERWLELSPESSDGRVSVQTETGTLDGRAEGLTADGCLRVRDAAGLHEIAVGEVVKLRPA